MPENLDLTAPKDFVPCDPIEVPTKKGGQEIMVKAFKVTSATSEELNRLSKKQLRNHHHQPPKAHATKKSKRKGTVGGDAGTGDDAGTGSGARKMRKTGSSSRSSSSSSASSSSQVPTTALTSWGTSKYWDGTVQGPRASKTTAIVTTCKPQTESAANLSQRGYTLNNDDEDDDDQGYVHIDEEASDSEDDLSDIDSSNEEEIIDVNDDNESNDDDE
jgi:hypothetical protein